MAASDDAATSRWQLARAEAAMSALEDIGFGKHDIMDTLADFMLDCIADITAARTGPEAASAMETGERGRG